MAFLELSGERHVDHPEVAGLVEDVKGDGVGGLLRSALLARQQARVTVQRTTEPVPLVGLDLRDDRCLLLRRILAVGVTETA
jgi:hypothetical protein